MRRIDPISFVATQLGTREVPNLGGIDDADDMTSLVQRARDAETIAPGGFQTGVNPSHPLGDQPIEEMAPSIRGVRKAPCAHLVAARHARVQRVFGNVDTQYPVDHCPILLPCLFSKSSASNNLVRRIYAHARPKIPSNLHSGAWKTGPNLPHGLIRQRDARGSPFSSQLSKMCLFAKQSATYKGCRCAERFNPKPPSRPEPPATCGPAPASARSRSCFGSSPSPPSGCCRPAT